MEQDIQDTYSALDVNIHPLVIVNMSDHYTREKVRKGEQGRVFGALLGNQKNRRVEIVNTFAFLLSKDGDKYLIDSSYLETKIEQFMHLYDDLELLGWYSTGSTPQDYDMEVHEQLTQFNESPLYLLLDAESEGNELPITLLESQVKVIGSKPSSVFVKMPYKIETSESERIAVDHVANASDKEAELTSNLSNILKAVNMFNQRVNSIKGYVDENSDNKNIDQKVFRHIKALCNQYPSIDSLEFNDDFLTEYNDTLLMTHLATLTKTANTMNDLVEKFNDAFEKQRGRRGMY